MVIGQVTKYSIIFEPSITKCYADRQYLSKLQSCPNIYDFETVAWMCPLSLYYKLCSQVSVFKVVTYICSENIQLAARLILFPDSSRFHTKLIHNIARFDQKLVVGRVVNVCIVDGDDLAMSGAWWHPLMVTTVLLTGANNSFVWHY